MYVSAKNKSYIIIFHLGYLYLVKTKVRIETSNPIRTRPITNESYSTRTILMFLRYFLVSKINFWYWYFFVYQNHFLYQKIFFFFGKSNIWCLKFVDLINSIYFMLGIHWFWYQKRIFFLFYWYHIHFHFMTLYILCHPLCVYI